MQGPAHTRNRAPRCETAFMEGHLKNCPEMRKSRKNCIKSNQFAKTCRSYEINELTANTKSSDEDCRLIQNFETCDEFEFLSIEIIIHQSGEPRLI